MCLSFDDIMANNQWLTSKDSKVKFWIDNWLGSPIVDLVNLSNFSWDPGDLVFAFINLDGSSNRSSNFISYFHVIVDLINKATIVPSFDILVSTLDTLGKVIYGSYY